MSVSIYKALDRDFLRKFERMYSEGPKTDRWVFRGERQRKDGDRNNPKIPSAICLETSLDKAFDRYNLDSPDNEGLRYDLQDLEMSLLREFQRKAHLHLPYIPEVKNTIEWLTFMQHYGGPTRFLDWTYSFYVAVFFALARLDHHKEFGEVWAVNSNWLGEKEKDILTDKTLEGLYSRRKEDAINMDAYHNKILKYFLKERKQFVILLNSFHLNERLINQQGTFLVQGNVDQTFGQNLEDMGNPDELKENVHKIVIEVNNLERNKILKELNDMNITNATLFPGLQGFTESLETQLAYPEKFGLKKKRI